ncbi:uncharacterized protein LOC144887299 [Branchiostoma floridae x Branchiostoma japonicum]
MKPVKSFAVFIVCVLSVTQAQFQVQTTCSTNVDCLTRGCCRVDGTVVFHWASDSAVTGQCGLYLQEGEECRTGVPFQSVYDCQCADGLLCFPNPGGYAVGTCRTRQYVDDHGGMGFLDMFDGK